MGSDITNTFYDKNYAVSIHAPRVGSDAGVSFDSARCDRVSIHAPRVGSDSTRSRRVRTRHSFYPRSPCGERHAEVVATTAQSMFLSTLPVWGATAHRPFAVILFTGFYPRSQCGERPRPHHFAASCVLVSIHAPSVGSDHGRITSQLHVFWFLSTLPVWGATANGINRPWVEGVSIHAPRVGSDGLWKLNGCEGQVFLSTLLVWGATTTSPDSVLKLRKFLSTLLVWGATLPVGAVTDGDLFLSTLLVWGATELVVAVAVLAVVSIHAPRVGSDR